MVFLYSTGLEYTYNRTQCAGGMVSQPKKMKKRKEGEKKEGKKKSRLRRRSHPAHRHSHSTIQASASLGTWSSQFA